MASNATHAVETGATDRLPFAPSQSPKRRRLSWRTQLPPPSDDMAAAVITTADPHTALLHGHDHEGLGGRARHLVADDTDDDAFVNKNASKQLEKMITPYLAQHIPQQYHPLGGFPQTVPANTKYCYRHRPDLLCRRQADEPSMEQLQDVRVACHADCRC